MAILTGCHAKRLGLFACAQAGCPDCLETCCERIEADLQGDPAARSRGDRLCDWSRRADRTMAGNSCIMTGAGICIFKLCLAAIRHECGMPSSRQTSAEDPDEEVEACWNWWERSKKIGGGALRQALLEVWELPARLGRVIPPATGWTQGGTALVPSAGVGVQRNECASCATTLCTVAAAALSLQLPRLCERTAAGLQQASP